MIINETNVKILDNSGGQIAQCIKILGSKKIARIGDEIVVSIKKVRKNTQSKVKRGEVYRAVIVQTKKEFRRKNGVRLQFDDNSIVLVNNKKEPIGNRVNGSIPIELGDKGWLKVLSLAKSRI